MDAGRLEPHDPRREYEEVSAEFHAMQEAKARGEDLSKRDLDEVRRRVEDAKARALRTMRENQPGR